MLRKASRQSGVRFISLDSKCLKVNGHLGEIETLYLVGELILGEMNDAKIGKVRDLECVGWRRPLVREGWTHQLDYDRVLSP
jgi:hypothetical protein